MEASSARCEVLRVLSSQYTRKYRLVETLATVVGLGLFVLYAYLVWLKTRNSIIMSHFLMGIVMGLLLADLAAGMIHWFADTWGTVELPLLGQTLVRSFREHHIDPMAITRHDFVETNGSSFLVAIPFLLVFITTEIKALKNRDPSSSSFASFQDSFLFTFALTTTFSNQTHKWAHMISPPFYIKLLQRLRIIIPRKQHHIHHISPHACYYSITNGWTNYPLELLHFWRFLETIVTRVFGCVPRQDDLSWYNAAYSEKPH